MSDRRHATSWRVLAILTAILLIPQSLVGASSVPRPSSSGLLASDPEIPVVRPGAHPLTLDEEIEERLLELDTAYVSRRLAGDQQLTLQQAGALRAAAAHQASLLRQQGAPTAGPVTFDVPWSGLGPNPIVQLTRGSSTFTAMSGRIGALAIRPSTGQFILGAAQGGIWLYDAGTGTWTPKTDDLPSLSMGALAVAPSNDAIIYAGTGEGALSGDSYFGNGILKSTDGGQHWQHVSGDYFVAVSISSLVVDPGNANHLYASVLRGRGGARRTSPAVHSQFGIWESKDGGTSWKLLKEAKSESNGATALVMDPQDPSSLYASFWSDAIYHSADGGQHWATFMAGIPPANHAANQTRFALGLSHPAAGDAVLYAGFDWQDADYHPSRVWKSVNGGAWSLLPAGTGDDTVEDYCGGQCFYDNVIAADPSNPDIVYAGGQFNYDIGSGGIFRSDDGGQTWKNLGWDQHPDYHALAFDPSNPAHILVGSDGGVWFSADRGGRPNASDPLSAVTWVNLNGTVTAGGGVLARSNLQISQFSSIATVPQVPPGADGPRFWGGTQDNGTLRKSVNSKTWFDTAGGDGGQVLVDPTSDSCALAPSCFVYGTYFGISPYRFTDGGGFFTNSFIRNGLNQNDRSDFYVPFVMNKFNPNQLMLGTFRLYRTDNARASAAGDVLWKVISPDLTGGCLGTAPNGARTCAISAIGLGGGNAAYVGTLDGRMWISTNALTSSNPSWTRLDLGELPNRPVGRIAVDRSNYRIAYAAYNGFNGATPSRPGHVFKTTDGGANWTNISGNLPDSPVNSIVLDPSFPDTLYVGTDVGPFATYDGGTTWAALGSGFPIVSIEELDLDTSHRMIAAGTHGRGAFSITDNHSVPSLVISKVDAGVPIGPTSNLAYTITLRNIGNAGATGVTVTDPVPAQTSFVGADSGGALVDGKVTWNGLSIAAGASITLHFSVNVADALKNKVKAITNDGITVTSAEGPGTTGSPTTTPIAPPYAVSLSPASQTDGTRPGQSVTYQVTVKNLGFNPDSYGLTSTGATYTTTFLDATCTTPTTTVGPLAPGATANVCVKVDVPGGAANGDTSTATVTATSAANPSVSASATLKTIAVTLNVLLVDNDGNGPNVQSYYTAALTTAGVAFNTWDLSVDPNIPLGYMKAHKTIVWFTGNSYPGPLLPYESRLQAFLDNGGRLFMSGHDILDQAAGTTAFVHDYLHISWDGTEAQNDKATSNVHEVAATLSAGVGTVPLDHSVLGAAFEDRITPINGAIGVFTDDATAYDALSFTGTYKVVFLAFPLEAYGSATQKADLISRVMTYFGP